jgi:uncharacterized protein (DUF2141 family)
MKTIIILSVLFSSFTSPELLAQRSLEITVENIKDIKGSMRVGIYNTEKDFPDKPTEGKVVQVSAETLTVLFEGVQPGDYAISIFHDENNNGELDTNGVGIPKEGFAFGNNAMGMFGPPSFDKAKITIGNENLKQTLKLKHF